MLFNAIAAARVPPLMWAMAEPFRATTDLWRCAVSSFVSPDALGTGQPVLVVPGFTADDDATAFLRSYLIRAGFDAHGWGLGRNLGPACAGIDGDILAAQVRELHQKSGRKVSLIGWSLGGLMARDVARARPQIVRQVIALGCPLRGDTSGSMTAEDRMPVPYTAICSQSDGVVHWEDCVPANTDRSEVVEVQSSHWGLVTSADVRRVIVDRLTQDDDSWAPFGRGA